MPVQRGGPAIDGRWKIWVVSASLLALTVAIGWNSWIGNRLSSSELLTEASLALAARDYRRAQQLCDRIPSDDPMWSEAQLVSGEAAFRDGRVEEAMALYDSVPRDDSPTSVKATFVYAEICRDYGRLTEAEEAYRSVIARTPDYDTARQRLAFVLNVAGRRWESQPHLMQLIQRQHWTVNELAVLGDLERPISRPDYLARCQENVPDDLSVLQGLAQLATADGRTEDALELLGWVVASDPENTAAQAALGELLLESVPAEFERWHAALPPGADGDPNIWYVRGVWARRLGEQHVAARCFWETVRIAPTHRRGNYALGQALLAVEHPAGQAFTDRGSRMSELGQVLSFALDAQGRHEPSLKHIAEAMEELGRFWEAGAWAMEARQRFPLATWPVELLDRVMPQLRPDLPQVAVAADLARQIDLGDWQDHRTLAAGERPDNAAAAAAAEIRFEEESAIGIDFVYDNAGDGQTAALGARMFEQSGGGVAVLDYDCDNTPDLYFSQGADWPRGDAEPTPSAEKIDRLFRNRHGRGFVDSTPATGLGNPGFGQGPAAGDFNNDGFVDLYVANVGRNRLFLNNGDGTFSDVSDAAGLVEEEWTTSCVIADLNADGQPDLFDVNYVSGPDVYTITCNGRSCGPQTFDGTLDRYRLSRGDGRFESQTVNAPVQHAKGLGVVVADIAGTGRPSLFIANDQTPNFFLTDAGASGWELNLRDTAFVTGLAFNEHGLAMGCMGIAADDADGDERLDFFVTNFANEYNNLYRQDRGGMFVDTASRSGIRDSSLHYVGWGTQFLDADRDGNPDLVVTNGHVDDFRPTGGHYQMPAQFFRNTGDAEFVELDAAGLGSYFERLYLGRGLARLDWNQDGLMDFVVSNIGDEASLVTNHTSGAGHYLNVRLTGCRSARDAIGASVTVSAGNRRWMKQLVAGDGYMATNERVLQFGLGEASAIESVRVEWPSGGITMLEGPRVDGVVHFVENGLDAVSYQQSANEWRIPQ